MTDRRWGHIKLSRRLFEEDEWWNEKRPRTKIEAWLDCIYMAAWKPRKFAVGFEVEQLQRGEFMASLRFLAERWQWAKRTVERWLEVGIKAGRLERRREGQGGTVYLLVNYEHYQGNDPIRETPAETAKEPPERHRRDKTEAVKQVRTTWMTPFADLWSARCGNPPFGKLAAVLGPLVQTHEAPEVLNRWSRYLSATDPKFCSVHRFAETFNTWAEPDTQEMTDDFGVMRLHRKDRQSGQWVVAS